MNPPDIVNKSDDVALEKTTGFLMKSGYKKWLENIMKNQRSKSGVFDFEQIMNFFGKKGYSCNIRFSPEGHKSQ